MRPKLTENEAAFVPRPPRPHASHADADECAHECEKRASRACATPGAQPEKRAPSHAARSFSCGFVMHGPVAGCCGAACRRTHRRRGPSASGTDAPSAGQALTRRVTSCDIARQVQVGSARRSASSRRVAGAHIRMGLDAWTGKTGSRRVVFCRGEVFVKARAPGTQHRGAACGRGLAGAPRGQAPGMSARRDRAPTVAARRLRLSGRTRAGTAG